MALSSSFQEFCSACDSHLKAAQKDPLGPRPVLGAAAHRFIRVCGGLNQRDSIKEKIKDRKRWLWDTFPAEEATRLIESLSITDPHFETLSQREKYSQRPGELKDILSKHVEERGSSSFVDPGIISGLSLSASQPKDREAKSRWTKGVLAAAIHQHLGLTEPASLDQLDEALAFEPSVNLLAEGSASCTNNSSPNHNCPIINCPAPCLILDFYWTLDFSGLLAFGSCLPQQGLPNSCLWEASPCIISSTLALASALGARSTAFPEAFLLPKLGQN